jgi:hypothetical protein
MKSTTNTQANPPVVPPFIASQPAADPIDNLFGVVGAFALAVTDTGPPAPNDEHLRELEHVEQQVQVLLASAVQAECAADYAPPATVGEIESRAQEYANAAINVLKVAPRDRPSWPWPWIMATRDETGFSRRLGAAAP